MLRPRLDSHCSTGPLEALARPISGRPREIVYSSMSSKLLSVLLVFIESQARENHPYLKQFQNDWATAEIVKQFITNRRKRMKKQLELEDRCTHPAVGRNQPPTSTPTSQSVPHIDEDYDEGSDQEQDNSGVDADNDALEFPDD